MGEEEFPAAVCGRDSRRWAARRCGAESRWRSVRPPLTVKRSRLGYDAIIDHTAPDIKLRRPVCVACSNAWISEQEKRVGL